MGVRLDYSLTELSSVYELLITRAYKYIDCGCISKSLSYVKRAARIQYLLCDRVVDHRCTVICKACSSALLGCDYSYEPNDGVFLFYDSFTWDNRGLTQQYLDAIACIKDTKIVFVNEKKYTESSSHIYDFLKTINAEIYELGVEGSDIEKIKVLHNIIMAHQPSKAFFHLTPYTIIPFVAFSNAKNCLKYQINLTDHAFWIGDGSFFDYSFEFRDFGCNLSLTRGFKEEQIVDLPYYPWSQTEGFKGLPVNTDGKKVLFSGGALWKLDGDDDSYFIILKRILDDNPNLLFFYAGDGDRTRFNKFISINGYELRVFLLGNRSDIPEIIKRVDIYLGTFPVGGGLMSQFAAVNGKPLLIYGTTDIDEVLCNVKHDSIVFNDIDAIVAEARRLLIDDSYYNQKSKYYQSLVINQDTFRKLFITAIGGKSPREWSRYSVEIPNKENLARINNVGYEMDGLLFPCAPLLLNIKVIFNRVSSLPYLFKRISRYIKRISKKR